MAKQRLLISAIAAALVFFSSAFVGIASLPNFIVRGRVYCDTCRAGFETTATEYISGAKVQMQCRNFTTGKLLHTVDAQTDSSGYYELEVVDDREDEICEVVLGKSPLSECSEVTVGRDRARVMLTHNVGILTNVRYANSLGYLKDNPLSECGSLLKQYALGDDPY